MTNANTYKITNCTELQKVSNDLSGSYELVNDIDCYDTINWNNGAGFIPIGEYNSFIGQFNGNNYVISNLYINNSIAYLGLFGNIERGVILDVRLENITITTHHAWAVGSLVGSNSGGNIFGSSAMGNISANFNDASVGGVVGINTGLISNCSFFGYICNSNAVNSNVGGLTGLNFNGGTIIGSNVDAIVKDLNSVLVSIGGLVGHNSNASISGSNFIGNVNGSLLYIGGLIGSDINGRILNSNAIGNVSGSKSSSVGGAIGQSFFSNISECSFNGTVKNDGSAGGFVYLSYSSNISNSTAAGNITGDIAGGFVGWNIGRISGCNFTGNVNAKNKGGCLVGHNDGEIVFSNTKCNINGTTSIGILVGYNHGNISHSIADGNAVGTKDTGILIGTNYYSYINYCAASGIAHGIVNTGGIGNNEWSVISNCVIKGDVFGVNDTGLFVGSNYCSHISTSSAEGSVTGENIAGGFAGSTFVTYISDSYAQVAVKGNTIAGFAGMVGPITNIARCYCVTKLDGLDKHPFIGKIRSEPTILNSYYDMNVSNQDSADYGTPKTTDDMYNKKTYHSWDFNYIWSIINGLEYPKLIWEQSDSTITRTTSTQQEITETESVSLTSTTSPSMAKSIDDSIISLDFSEMEIEKTLPQQTHTKTQIAQTGINLQANDKTSLVPNSEIFTKANLPLTHTIPVFCQKLCCVLSLCTSNQKWMAGSDVKNIGIELSKDLYGIIYPYNQNQIPGGNSTDLGNGEFCVQTIYKMLSTDDFYNHNCTESDFPNINALNGGMTAIIVQELC